MVPTNMRVTMRVTNIPRTCVRAIENLQIFFRFFSVTSFLSSDYTVPITMSNMCQNIPRTVRAIKNLQIFKFSLELSVFYQFSEEISWPSLICVKLPFHYVIIFQFGLHGFHYMY